MNIQLQTSKCIRRTSVSLVAKKIAKHYPMGVFVCYLKQQECHFVEQVTRRTVKTEPSSVGSAISQLNKHRTAVGICFYHNFFGILEVKSGRDQTSKRIETRVWIANAVKQVRARAAEIDRMAA